MSYQVSVDELAENACHFGHKVARWNPRIAPYLWGKKGGVHIFDLEQTAKGVEKTLTAVAELAKTKKTILFVSTKPQTKGILQEIHDQTSHPIVNTRWVGGFLTNFDTVKHRLKKLKELRDMVATGDIDKFPKKEQAQMRKEMAKLEERFGGVVDMYRRPNAVFVVVDGNRDHIAIQEAIKLGIPVYGIADSNVNPEEYTEVIPANDDAITSLTFLMGKVFEALQAKGE